jgi:hypothetical protein
MYWALQNLKERENKQLILHFGGYDNVPVQVEGK